jgi:hypothetical protein
MTRTIAFVLLAIATSGCASKHELAQCGGPAEPVNPRTWTPTPQQQAELDRLVQEACK